MSPCWMFAPKSVPPRPQVVRQTVCWSGSLLCIHGDRLHILNDRPIIRNGADFRMPGSGICVYFRSYNAMFRSFGTLLRGRSALNTKVGRGGGSPARYRTQVMLTDQLDPDMAECRPGDRKPGSGCENSCNSQHLADVFAIVQI